MIGFDMPALSLSRRKLGASAVAIAVALGAYASVYSVDQTEGAVRTTFGEVTGVAGPGLHFKIPFMQGATIYRTDTQTVELVQKRPACGGGANDDAKAMSGNTTYTRDQQFIYASATAQYNLPAGAALTVIYGNYPNYAALMSNFFNQAAKEVLGNYNTTEIPAARLKISDEMKTALIRQVEAKGLPVTVGSAQFGNFDFSCQYEQQVEKAAEAKTDLTKNETLREIQRVLAEKTVIEAQATKQKETLEGQGDAARILAVATAQAEGAKLLSDALASNPLIVAYERAKRWDGALPRNMYGSAPIPFLDAGVEADRPVARTKVGAATPTP